MDQAVGDEQCFIYDDKEQVMGMRCSSCRDEAYMVNLRIRFCPKPISMSCELVGHALVLFHSFYTRRMNEWFTDKPNSTQHDLDTNIGST